METSHQVDRRSRSAAALALEPPEQCLERLVAMFSDQELDRQQDYRSAQATVAPRLNHTFRPIGETLLNAKLWWVHKNVIRTWAAVFRKRIRGLLPNAGSWYAFPGNPKLNGGKYAGNDPGRGSEMGRQG